MYLIEGFENLTPQQCFNMSARHILTTRRKSVRGEQCVYGDSGCAASVFLTKEGKRFFDNKSAQGQSASWTHVVCYLQTPESHVNSTLITALQRAHDSCFEYRFMEMWKAHMRAIAIRFGLDPSILDEDQ